MKSSLRSKAFELLKTRPANMKLSDIAEGSGLPLTWVKSFHLKGGEKNSSADKIQTLYEYLSGKQLKL